MPEPPERPPVGYFWIRAAFADDRRDYHWVDGWMGPTLPVPQQGYGGWAEQTRKRRRTALRWDGSPPLIVPLDCVFGSRSPRARKKDSIETDIRRLEKLAGLTGDGDEPPLVQWAANAMHDYNEAPRNLWVIDDIQWSTDPKDWKKNDEGAWTLARGTAIMKLWSKTSYFQTNAAKEKRKSDKDKKKEKSGDKVTPKNSKYTVRAGDSLSSIASDQLGSASRWPELAKLNKKRDPDDVTVGEVIKLK